MASREKVKFGKVMLTGVRKYTPSGAALLVLLEDEAGDALLATGTSVPASYHGTVPAGYAKGCLFIKTDVVDGQSGLYVNAGTRTFSNFKQVTNAP